MIKTATWQGQFLMAAAAYLALQAVLRASLGGALEVDEAEMVLLAQDWRWGYGPQLPLYTWFQVASFDVFGLTAAGLAIPKAIGLWLAAAGLALAMGQAFENRGAALAATLSLAFLPNVIWEMQRASSHSIAMIAALTWTLWAWFRVMKRGSLGDWAWLGLCLGLGALTKYNFWAVPLALALCSFGLWPRPAARYWPGLAMALALALAIAAVPYSWAVMHPDKALASVDKFYDGTRALGYLQAAGLWAGNAAAGLVLAVLVGLGTWAAAGRPGLGPVPWASRLLGRAAVLVLGAALVLILVFGVTKVQAR